MTLVAAMINKLGLRQAPELLWPVYDALIRRAPTVAAPPATSDTALERVPWQPAATQPISMRELVDAIDRAMMRAPDTDAEPNAPPRDDGRMLDAARALALPALKPISEDEGNPSASQEQLAYWLLNAQADGTVAHRIGALPLLLGDRLIEVEMSFFEQRRDAEQKPDAKHRKIVFSLQLEHLGRIEVMARLAGERASVSVAAQDQDKTAAVARYVGQLKSLLTGLGWTVDEVAYETRHVDRYNGVVRSVVEHVVSHDALDRLV